jgi:hypothetical protein
MAITITRSVSLNARIHNDLPAAVKPNQARTMHAGFRKAAFYHSHCNTNPANPRYPARQPSIISYLQRSMARWEKHPSSGLDADGERKIPASAEDFRTAKLDPAGTVAAPMLRLACDF